MAFSETLCTVDKTSASLKTASDVPGRSARE